MAFSLTSNKQTLIKILAGLRTLTFREKYWTSARHVQFFGCNLWTINHNNGIIPQRNLQSVCFANGILVKKTGINNLSHVKCRYTHDEHPGLPTFSEEELEEKFTRGHGPGGQSVNKSTNCCVLKHLPTGVTVKVHESRSLDQNRKLARLRLRQKLDQHLNKEESQREIERREASINRKTRKKKTNERLEKLRAFKEREGLS